MKISKGTIVRTVMVFIVIINLILKQFGIKVLPVDQSAVAGIVEALISIAAIVSAWWYNNSFSKKAKRADEFFKQLKEGEVDV